LLGDAASFFIFDGLRIKFLLGPQEKIRRMLKKRLASAQELKKAAEVHAGPFRPPVKQPKRDIKAEQEKRRLDETKAGQEKRAKLFAAMVSGICKHEVSAPEPPVPEATQSQNCSFVGQQ
jgi:hypothetical protein